MMPRRLLLCCSLLLVVFAAYQVPKDKATVEGRVVGASTGEPLGKVSLLLKPSGSEGQAVSTESDSDGKFVFEGVSPGSYMLIGERTGYLRQAYGAKRNPLTGTPLALTAGGAFKDLTFRMTQPAAISGRVLDKDGEPAPPGFLVTALKAGYVRGKRQYGLSRVSGLDAKGKYRIENLSAGQYLVFATVRGIAPLVPAPEQPAGAPVQSFADTYYPSSIDQAAAMPVQVGFGTDVLGIDIRLVQASAVRLRGRVVGLPEGWTASVVMSSKEGNVGLNARATQAAKDGMFEFRGVVRGTYSLYGNIIAQSPSEENSGFGGVVDIEVGDRPIEDIVLPYAPNVDLPGKVVVDGGHVAPQGFRVRAESVEGTWRGAQSSLMEDGSFLLKELGPTSYLIRVEGAADAGSWYVKSVRYSGRGTQDVVDLSGGSSDKVQITLSAAAAQVFGVVHSKEDKPVSGATVALIPDSGRRWLYKTATTDQSGAFSMKGITPGDYKLLAWEDIEPGAEEDPEFVKQFASRWETMSLKETDRNSIRLKAIPATK